ncbi:MULTISPECIES: hypothetical protein [unclassified Nonomuraea]|nr:MULTISPECIES: hypothetical protein [unclassified Nonomuraea]
MSLLAGGAAAPPLVVMEGWARRDRHGPAGVTASAAGDYRGRA